MNRLCWRCDGRGWVSDGQMDDGRFTGRANCSACSGTGKLTDEQIVEHIHRVLSKARVP